MLIPSIVSNGNKPCHYYHKCAYSTTAKLTAGLFNRGLAKRRLCSWRNVVAQMLESKRCGK